MGLLQRRRSIDPLAPWLTGKGIDYQLRRAHQAGFHCRGGLDREEFVHQRRVDTATELCEHCGEHAMLLGGRNVDFGNTTGLQDGKIRAQAAANLLIGAVQLMLPSLQR